MIHHILKYIGGIEHYGIASLCIFGGVFIGVLLWTVLQKRSHLEYMSKIALDNPPEEERNSHE